MVAEMRDAAEEMRRLFVEGLQDAAENFTGGEAQKNTTQEGGVKRQARQSAYDYSKSFAQQVDDYDNHLISKSDSLIVGPTPDVLQKVGFNTLPVTINTTHVDYALYGTKDADHYLGKAALKQLPQSIKDPVAVFVSQTQSKTSVVALLNFKTNGKQTVAPVLIDGFGKSNGIIIDSNAITSIFGKTNAVSKLLFDAVNDESKGKFSLLYWNKKEATSLLHRAGLQLPGTLIPHDGFIHSIRENASPVKPKFENIAESQQFKRWLGSLQRSIRTLWTQCRAIFLRSWAKREMKFPFNCMVLSCLARKITFHCCPHCNIWPGPRNSRRGIGRSRTPGSLSILWSMRETRWCWEISWTCGQSM